MLLSLKSDQIIEGMVLGQDIISSDGQLLMESGGVLAEKDISWISNVFTGTEVLLKEPRLDSSVSLSSGIIRKGVIASLLNKNDLEAMYVMMTLLKDSIGGYFSKLYPQLIDLRKADPVTFEHSLHVAWYSLFLGQALGLEEKSMLILLQGSLLHDIGKSYIPEPLLTKKGKLTAEEFNIIKRHSVYGEAWSKQFASKEVSDMIRHHHEYLNGEGYPDRLCGDQITDINHIVTVADIFDALSCTRSYRSAMSPFIAYGILQIEASNGKLKQKHVDAFRDILNCLSGNEVIVEGAISSLLDKVISADEATVFIGGNRRSVKLSSLSLPTPKTLD